MRPRTFSLAIGLLFLALGCSSPPLRANLVVAGRGPAGDAPLSPAQNQNAPPPEPTAPAALPQVILWCSQPTGPACTRLERELAAAATDATAIPAAMLTTARDLPDDCADPDLAPMMQRLASAIGIPVDEWADQGGQIELPFHVADVNAGGGCTNPEDPALPALKVVIVDAADGPHYFARVWEIGDQ